jgi:peptidoglycan/xylan/chitin deacetylase (PgdA/CDA1 family)
MNGEHAKWHPQITKEVVEAGMTIGTLTWSHKDLERKPYASDFEQAKKELEMGFSAVHMAAGVPIAPFFRFPYLQHPPQLLTYFAKRISRRFPPTWIPSISGSKNARVMSKLEKRGKSIILMHDFQDSTAEGLPELIRELQAGGYKVVHMVPREPLTTPAKYDEMVAERDKPSVNNTGPASSVVHTIPQ